MPYILPFIIAYILSFLFKPIVKRFDGIGVSRTFTALTCTFFLYFGFGSGVYFIIKRLFIQLSEFTALFLSSPEKYLGSLENIIEGITTRYPEIFSVIDIDAVKESFMEKLAEYAAVILEKTAGIAMNMPNILLFLFAMIFSTYYFIKSMGKRSDMISLLPKSVCAAIYYCKGLFTKYIKHYLFSMVIMLIIVFFMLMVGFWLMKVPYFILISLVVAIIDMLPILGVGTVLIPWSIYSFITGELGRGIGMLALYILIILVRQVSEPRLIGKRVGLSPLVTLISIYIGFRAFGIVGVIFAPFTAMAVMSLINELLLDNCEKGTP